MDFTSQGITSLPSRIIHSSNYMSLLSQPATNWCKSLVLNMVINNNIIIYKRTNFRNIMSYPTSRNFFIKLNSQAIKFLFQSCPILIS